MRRRGILSYQMKKIENYIPNNSYVEDVNQPCIGIIIFNINLVCINISYIFLLSSLFTVL